MSIADTLDVTQTPDVTSALMASSTSEPLSLNSSEPIYAQHPLSYAEGSMTIPALGIPIKDRGGPLHGDTSQMTATDTGILALLSLAVTVGNQSSLLARIDTCSYV